MVCQSQRYLVRAIVWSCFSGMEESFWKIVRENFSTLSRILQLQLQRVSGLSQRLDRKKRQFSLRLYNSLKNESQEFHYAYGLKDSLKTDLCCFPSKNRLARNIQILQVFFLQDLAQNLASFALKMKLFLQDMKNLARKLSYNFFLQDFCEIFCILQEKLHFSARLARFVQDQLSTRSCKSCKNNICKICIFLARQFSLG